MMFRQKEIIARKLVQLERMGGYLAYSDKRMRAAGVVDKDMGALSDVNAEILAAFRARFSEHQEHIGKLLKAIALEEGVAIIGMSDVLSFAEKAGIVESELDWKEPRDIRNAINHEYEESPQAVATLIREMLNPLWTTGRYSTLAVRLPAASKATMIQASGGYISPACSMASASAQD